MILKGVMPLAFEVQRRWLMLRGVRSEYARVDGARMHFFDLAGEGHGPPVVLVHGLGSSGGVFAECLFPLAARARRVLAPDLPGSGFSPLPHRGPLSLLAQLAVLERFVEERLSEPCVLVGNSLGGAMAARLASRNPDWLAAAVLISPAGARTSPERFQHILSTFAPRDARETARLVRLIYHRAPPLLPELMAEGLRATFAGPAVVRVLEDAKLEPALREAELAAIRAPTIVIWGRSERVLPYEGVDYFRAHLPPSAEVVEVEGFGHSPQLERPRELCERIIDFLDRRLPSRRAGVATAGTAPLERSAGSGLPSPGGVSLAGAVPGAP